MKKNTKKKISIVKDGAMPTSSNKFAKVPLLVPLKRNLTIEDKEPFH